MIDVIDQIDCHLVPCVIFIFFDQLTDSVVRICDFTCSTRHMSIDLSMSTVMYMDMGHDLYGI
jgi:hypothetical protein